MGTRAVGLTRRVVGAGAASYEADEELAVVRERLDKAGVRLAKILNVISGSHLVPRR